MPKGPKGEWRPPMWSLALFTSPKFPPVKFKRRTKLHRVQIQKRINNEPAKVARPAPLALRQSVGRRSLARVLRPAGADPFLLRVP